MGERATCKEVPWLKLANVRRKQFNCGVSLLQVFVSNFNESEAPGCNAQGDQHEHNSVEELPPARLSRAHGLDVLRKPGVVIVAVCAALICPGCAAWLNLGLRLRLDLL